MRLFHASHHEFEPGRVVTASGHGTYYPDVVPLLEAKQPSSVPSRSVCVFATDSIAAATSFLRSQSLPFFCDPSTVNNAPINVYEVEMSVFHKAPFRLVEEIHQRVGRGAECDSLVIEYWNPKQSWFFWEYFGPSFQVIDKVSPANTADQVIFGFRYEKDRTLSASLDCGEGKGNGTKLPR